MKRTMLILVALVAVNVANAQFFVKAGAGYNLSAVSQAQSITDIDSSGATIATASRYSYGNGIAALAAVGYDFSENLGFQVGVSYLLSSSALELESDFNGTGAFAGKKTTRTQTSKAKGPMFLMPAFTLASNGDKFNLYSRVGLTIPVAGEIETDVVYTATGETQTNKFISKGKMSLGYNAALGLGFPLSDKLSFWGELTGNFLNIKADTRTMTVYDYNGTDLLPNVPTRNKETIYVDKIDANTSTASTDPMSVIAQDSPFSSIGVSAGIKFSFGNSREERREAGE